MVLSKERLVFQPVARYLRDFSPETPVAVILGKYATSNLGVIHSLAPYHIPTIVIDARRQSTFFSRYTLGIQSPDPARSSDDYITFLEELGRHLPSKGVLFPTGDTETLLLTKQYDALVPYYHFTSAQYELIDTLIDKQALAALLEKHHIPHPMTVTVDPTSDIASISKDMTYPCILKPRYPTRFRLDFPTKVFHATSPAEFKALMRMAAAKGHGMIAQEIITGDADAMYGFNAYYDWSGRVHGAFNYQRIREWPLGFGNGCYLRQVQKPQMERMTTSLLKPLHYHGIVDVEFRLDHRDGVLKFIEINPRLWMQNSFPARLGCNHAYLAYQDAIGQTLPRSQPCADSSVRWVFGAEDLHSSLASMRQGTLSMREWLGAYRRKNVYATFSWHDPLPWVVAIYRTFLWSWSLALHRDTSVKKEEILVEEYNRF
jgi:D-aspartate ligase